MQTSANNDYYQLEFMDLTQCALCNSKMLTQFDSVVDTLTQEINRYLPADLPHLPLINNTRTKCIDCGYVFLSPRLTPDSLSLIYALWYQYAYNKIFCDQRLITERLYEFKKYHLRLINDFAVQKGKILDVGCGSGLFLHLAEQAGWQGVGLEFDAKTAEQGRITYQLDIRTGTLTSGLHADERFNAIALFDYLEHSQTPSQDLKALFKRLLPGGMLFVRVPNLHGWQAHYMQENWLAVIANHLSYFSPSVLRNSLTAYGFNVIHQTAHNYQNEFDIFRRRLHWCKDFLARAKQPLNNASAPDQPVASTGHTFLQNSQRFLNSLLIEQIDHVGGWFGRGNNLMIIAQRPVNEE